MPAFGEGLLNRPVFAVDIGDHGLGVVINQSGLVLASLQWWWSNKKKPCFIGGMAHFLGFIDLFLLTVMGLLGGVLVNKYRLLLRSPLGVTSPSAQSSSKARRSRRRGISLPIRSRISLIRESW